VGIIVLAMPLYAAAVVIGASRFVQETLGVDYRMAVLAFALTVAAGSRKQRLGHW
jgi:SSS family solute:Na+ symporter